MKFRDLIEDIISTNSTNYEWYSFDVDEYKIHILFDTNKRNLLTEAKDKGVPLGGHYSAKLHHAHFSKGQKHIHVFSRNNQLFSLNIDGSAHDDSHGITIPKRVAKGIEKKFPDFEIPPGCFIETASESVLEIFRRQWRHLFNE